MKKSSRGQRIFTITVVLIGLLTTGCSRGYAKEKTQDDMRAENIIITETGEVMEKPTPQAAATEEPTPTPEQGNAVQEPARIPKRAAGSGSSHTGSGCRHSGTGAGNHRGRPD